MKWTLARSLAASAAILAVLAVPAALAAPARSAGRAGLTRSAGLARSAGSVTAVTPVVLIGIPGLRWSDITPSATPALWRLAEAGSVGSLAVTTVDPLTCAADTWLTLNSGARAIDPHPSAGPCPALPAVVPQSGGISQPAGSSTPAGASPAVIPALPGLIRANRQYSYQPDWGLLGRTTPGQCAEAIGPGAAIALASPSGQVAAYLPGVAATRSPAPHSCALTVADLGALPAPAPAPAPAAGQARSARGRALRGADQAAAQIIAAAPAGAIVVVAGLGADGPQHLRAIIVSGRSYRDGLLTAASTRQQGLVQITDVTRSVLTWLGRDIPAALTGSLIGSMGRGSLSSSVRALTGQDTAAQVYGATVTSFFVAYGVTEFAVFCLIALLLRGGEQHRRRRRHAAYQIAGVTGGAVPAGTFLAGLVPWPLLAHPALVLYGLAIAWAVIIAAAALTGPWRRDPFGPPGFVGAVTVAVIGLDVITGSHLQLGAPFGLSALEAGRFYGVGNNALGIYGAAGILAAAWAGAAVLRRGRGAAVAAAGAVALFAVIAAGWPGFGAKVGGTIAMVPAFLLLLGAIAGLRVTPWRAAIIAVSGLLLITAFAVLNYLLPGTGPSDIGAFVGHVLHGGASPILHRKVSSNLRSLTESWLSPAVPVIVIVTGAMIGWPARLGLRTLARAFGSAALLRPALIAMWLAAVLGWLADDSGVSVVAAALPIALPLAVAVVSGIAAASDGEVREPAPAPGLLPDRAGRANL